MDYSNVIIKDGSFYTGEDFFYGSLAVENEKIKEMGSFEELQNKYPTIDIVDLEGKTVFPGFIDSHIHLVQTGFLKVNLDLTSVKSTKELKELIRADVKNKKPGEWIIGSSFDDNKFEDNKIPDKNDLDEVAPNNPVFIIRVCTHLMVANSKALSLAGIDAKTKAPEGGKIDQDEKGQPSGILRRNAGDLIYSIIYADTAMIKRAIQAALEYLKENGITTAHSMAIGVKNYQHYSKITSAYREALEEENYPTRVKLGAESEILNDLLASQIKFLDGDDYFNQGYIKLFSDGSYGSRTALLNEPYSDDPGNYGIEATTKNRIYEFTKIAHENGFQCAIHALGDQALSNILDVLEEITENGKNPLRHRIVHAGLSPDDLIERIKRHNLSVDIQPNFVASEVNWIEHALGERVSDLYTWKTMHDQGIRLAASSDSPVEPVNPFYGIKSAVTRQNLENTPPEGFNPKERITLKEAIDMYTINGAYQYFEENIKGSIATGKLADLVVLSNNPFEVNYDELIDIKVEMTFVGGRLVFQRN